jgi:hypothetical protein
MSLSMSRSYQHILRRAAIAALICAIGAPLAATSYAQDDAGPPPVADTTLVAKANVYDNLYQGQFTPGQGFDIIRTAKGTLNISVYGLFRYLNQLPAEQMYTDHLGGQRTVDARNDLNWHRTMIWLTGWFSDPKFRYNITAWSLASTEQTLIFGNLRYLMSEKMSFGIGISPNLTNRSLQGSWPFWAGSAVRISEERCAVRLRRLGHGQDKARYTTAIDRTSASSEQHR